MQHNGPKTSKKNPAGRYVTYLGRPGKYLKAVLLALRGGGVPIPQLPLPLLAQLFGTGGAHELPSMGSRAF